MPRIKVSSAMQAWHLALETLQMTYSGAKFVEYLAKVTLISFDEGCFVFEVPNEMVKALFDRHSERISIIHTLQVYMPDGASVEVDFQVAKAVQA